MAMKPRRREQPGISDVVLRGTKFDLHERIAKNSTPVERKLSHNRNAAIFI
jgi:hypothetical protein